MKAKRPPNRIRVLRKAKGWSQSRLAEAMPGERTFSLIAKLESGRQPLTHDYMVEIATIFDVKPIDLIQESVSGVIELPVIRSTQAGDWQEALQKSSETVVLPGDWASAASFVLRVVGDSMNNIVESGGFAVVNPNDRDLMPGKIYVFANAAHETTFKKFTLSPPQLEPCSNNPAHKIIPLGRETLAVIGRVIFAGTRL